MWTTGCCKNDSGYNFYFVKLSADLDERLARNETPHRMEMKASKRNVEWSRANLLQDTERYQLNSKDGKSLFENYLKIDNTNLSSDEVADIVIEKYQFVGMIRILRISQ